MIKMPCQYYCLVLTMLTLVGCTAFQPTPQTTVIPTVHITFTPTISAAPTTLVIPSELIDFVAQVAIEERLEEAAKGYRSPEGAIVAYVTGDTSGGELLPIQVWRCKHGKLVDEDIESFFKAIGNSQSDWPSFTLYFAFESVTSNEATVDLHTSYGAGRTENSRGGYAQRLDIEKQGNEWRVCNREVYKLWD